MLNSMIGRLILAFVISIMIASCGTWQTALTPPAKKKEVLVIYPDGTMMLNGRVMNRKDVVIYPDGHGGERAAVRVYVPIHPSFFRDTITVQRKDVEVERRE